MHSIRQSKWRIEVPVPDAQPGAATNGNLVSRIVLVPPNECQRVTVLAPMEVPGVSDALIYGGIPSQLKSPAAPNSSLNLNVPMVPKLSKPRQ